MHDVQDSGATCQVRLPSGQGDVQAGRAGGFVKHLVADRLAQPAGALLAVHRAPCGRGGDFGAAVAAVGDPDPVEDGLEVEGSCAPERNPPAALTGPRGQNELPVGVLDQGVLEYLTTRGWRMPESLRIRLERASVLTAIADQAVKLAARGVSVQEIGRTLNVSWETARKASTGQAGSATGPAALPPVERAGGGEPPSRRLAAEAVRLRDEEKLSMAKIGARLGVSGATARRAYDWAHREEFAAETARGRRSERGRCSYLGPGRELGIAERLAAGYPPREVAAEFGCGESTVRRIQKR